MKVQSIIYFSLFLNIIAVGQSPKEAPLPPKFDNMEAAISMNHFPSPVYASKDDTQSKYSYFWKHTTSFLSPTEPLDIQECGAYIYYNNQWNLRVTHGKKKCSNLFDCKKGKIKAGQPYTFKDNWRTDNQLIGGWAMWYIIGKTNSNQLVYGTGKLNTVGQLFPKK